MSFFTLAAPAYAELVEKKSRFIGYAAPAVDEAAAQAFLQEIRSRHRDATHNCYAYQVGFDNQIQRSSDDGEPSGTAGRPILEVIQGCGLQNIVVVVTRYFGGVLLGTGGLVRAYSAAAKGALAAAVLEKWEPAVLYSLTIDYAGFRKVERFLRFSGCKFTNFDFADKVDVEFAVPLTLTARLPRVLAGILGHEAQLVVLDRKTWLQNVCHDNKETK